MRAKRGRVDRAGRARRSPTAARTRSSAPGSTGAALAAGLLHVKRMPGVYRPGLAVLLPVPGRPVLLLDVGATVEVRPEQLVQFAFMGAAFMRGVMGVEQPAGRAAERRRGAREGHARSWPRRTRGCGALDGAAVRVRRQRRGRRPDRRRGGRGRHRRLHRQRGAEADGGHHPDAGGRDPRRDPRRARVSKLGGLLIRCRLGELRERLDPETVARRLPARPARPGGRLPRLLQPARDRERDRARGPRRWRSRSRSTGARSRRPALDAPQGVRAGARVRAR